MLLGRRETSHSPVECTTLLRWRALLGFRGFKSHRLRSCHSPEIRVVPGLSLCLGWSRAVVRPHARAQAPASRSETAFKASSNRSAGITRALAAEACPSIR